MLHSPPKIQTHPRMHACATMQQLFCYGKTIANHPKPWKLLFVLRQTKNIELNHDDTWAEPNVQRRACWFNTQTDCAAPAPHLPFNLLCLLTVLLRSGQDTIKIHDSLRRSRGCVVAQALFHHPRCHSAGPIQLSNGSPSLFATDATPSQNPISPLFLIFMGNKSIKGGVQTSIEWHKFVSLFWHILRRIRVCVCACVYACVYVCV